MLLSDACASRLGARRQSSLTERLPLSRPRTHRTLLHPPRASTRIEEERKREERAQSRTFAALNAVMQTLQTMVSASGDMFGASAGSSSSAPAVAGTAVARPVGKSKWVKWRGRAQVSRAVQQPRGARRLDAYLKLPAEEYNLLDPGACGTA
jgi:hypothetical protein